MIRALVVLAVGLVVLALAAPSSSATARERSSAVTSWIQLDLDAIASHRTNPPRAARALALVSTAMYEAAEADTAADDAAVAGAASTVLAYLYPDEAARIAALADPYRGCPAAFARGTQIGERLVERGQTDGSAATWTGTTPVGHGFWVPTPPAFASPPLEPLAGTWRTWNLSSGSQFRPGAPPRYGTVRFFAEVLEVYVVSKKLTPEQKQVADFWADGAGTVTPPGHWNAITIELVRDAGWSVPRTARLFAALNTAQADAFIASWDAKYAYWSLRPVTAIRRLIEPSWLPYIVTPPFPSYISGHSTTSGAASTVLIAFFPRQNRKFADLAEEAAASRLYGGIHFRSDNAVGLALGRRIGSLAVDAYTSP